MTTTPKRECLLSGCSNPARGKYCSKSCSTRSRNARKSRELRERIPKELLHELYVRKNLPRKKVSEMLGVSLSTLHKLLSEYGLQSPGRSVETKRKTRETCLKRFGAENPSQAESVKGRKRETNLLRSGGAHNWSAESSHRAACNRTHLERYGRLDTVNLKRELRPRVSREELRLKPLLSAQGFEHTGDRAFWVTWKDGTRHCPDYVNRKERRVVEYFGAYWHRNDRGREEEIKAKWCEVGWECEIVWSEDLEEVLSGRKVLATA